MGKLFNMDSPIMRVLGKIADIMWLNLLTAICCIPIITAGAAFTALHYTCLKLVRDEESYVTKDFFNSFKENIKQGILLWLIVVFAGLFIAFDFWCLVTMTESGSMVGFPVIIVFAGLCVVTIFVLSTVTFLFPIQSHFSNTIKGTIRNSFMMSVLVLPKTVLMVVIMVLPMGVLILADYFQAFYSLIPIAILFWFSGPAYLMALLYNKTFKRFEPEDGDKNDDFTWSVDGGETAASEENEPKEQ